MEGDLEGGGKEISRVVGIELGKGEEEGGGKKMGKEMRMEVWKELGKEVSMEMGEGGKGGEQGDEDGDGMLVRMEMGEGGGETGGEGGEEEGQVPQIERFIKNCPLPPALPAHRKHEEMNTSNVAPEQARIQQKKASSKVTKQVNT